MKDIRSGEEITVQYASNYFSRIVFPSLAPRNGKVDGDRLKD